MRITIIAAVGRDGAIGRDGDLAFHIRADLRRFKALTTGHTVIMGRRTFESLPKGALPDRRNIVVTRNPGFAAPGVETARTPDEAISMAHTDTEAFIIGGGTIYRQTMPLADRLELTRIDAESPGADTYFPEIDKTTWHVIACDGPHTDERTGLPYTFVTMARR